MLKFLNTVKLSFLLILLLNVTIGVSQNSTDILPQTIILKIKKELRPNCLSSKIEIQAFNRILNEIDPVYLRKMFPNKKAEKKEGNMDLSLIYELKYTNSLLVNDVIRKIKKLKIAVYVEPYYLPQLTYSPSDTLIKNQGYLDLMQAENAWDITKGDTSIIIGITDTGWDPTHPDLIDNVKINYNDPVNGIDDDGDGYIDNYMGWDLGMDDNDALWESSGHGVNVTGIAAATTDNVTGIPGIGFKTKFLPIKISNSVGILNKAYQGIVYAADHGCFVINCSWGSYVPSQFGQDIIDYATINKGCLVVGAAGNDDGEGVFYPSNYNGVLSVASTDSADVKADFSNYGYYIDISSPGKTWWTTGPNGGYTTNGGTSMSAPAVSGGAALIKAQFPNYNNYQIAALIQATADDLNAINPTYNGQLGSGRINLFNGVSAVGVQFLELTDFTQTDHNDNVFIAGDTIRIKGLFQNYLAPIGTTSVTLTCSSPYVTILDGTASLTALGTMDTTSNYLDQFTTQVLAGAGLNEELLFKAVITDGTFTNVEYFTIILNPDYIHLAENKVSTTITSNGKIGRNDNGIGLGFSYNNEQLLYEAGLMIGDGSTRVADVVRGISGPDNDFRSSINVRFNPPYVSALDLYGTMNDALLENPMDLYIKQFSYAYPNSPDDKYVMVTYRITNGSSSSLTNLYAGIFADWDIDNAGMNKAGYDASRKMGYVYAMSTDSVFAAIKVLSAANALSYAIDLDGSDVVHPNSGGYTTDEKYTSLSTHRNSAGGVNGGDVAHVVASGNLTLAPGATVIVAFAIIAGDSLLDIQASADAAQIRYDEDALTVQESKDERGFNLYPNPTTGVLKIATEEFIERMVVRNVLGEIVSESNGGEMDISDLSNGVYFVEVITPSTRVSKKVLLQK
jgi:serine protease